MKLKRQFLRAVLPSVLAIGRAANAEDAAPKQPASPTALENSLGMKLVPVKATPNLLWSVHETREKDYAAYRQEMREGWRKPDFETGPDHPVVYVTPKAASEFCEWLTMRELERGLIKAGQWYRLPTDEEWSLAAGLRGEVGETPAERHLKVKGHWPWGQDPHPVPGTGNFGDEAFHRRFPHMGWLRGVDDGFVFSAPVGSFAPDANGLLDLGGNVSEWVAPVNGQAWSRGGSWHPLAGVRPLLALELSWRTGRGQADAAVCEFTGFRVVLARPGEADDDLPGHELRRAAHAGDAVEVGRILQESRFADLPDATGMTAMHWAANLGHTAVVEMLIRHGASVLLETKRGQMALEMALFSTEFGPRAVPSARLLIEAGTPLNRDAMDGIPLLAIAIMSAPVDLVALLIDKGAFPDEPERRAAAMSILGMRRFLAPENDEMLALLVKAGGELKRPDRHGRTALHRACSISRVDRLQLAWLISHGLDVSTRDEDGLTPLDHLLMRAVESDGVQDAARFLLENGAPPDGDRTPALVREIATSGRNDLAAKVIAAGLVLANERPEKLTEAAAKALGLPGGVVGAANTSVLGEYALTGDAALLAAAVERGVSGRAPDAAIGDIGLSTSAMWGRADLLQNLIAHGANPSPPVGEMSLLCFAAKGLITLRNDAFDGASNLGQFFPSLSSLWRRGSATADYAECVRILLAAGAPVDDGRKRDPKTKALTRNNPTPGPGGLPTAGPSSSGETPLAAAARANRAEVVEALLNAGADLEFPDASGYTPLISAAEFGSADAARALLSHGANVDAATHDGTTALIEAATVGDLETVESLLARRPNLEAMVAPPREGTALSYAVFSGRAAVAARLLDAGARIAPRKKDDPLGTLLHTAVRGALQRRANAIASPPLDSPASLDDYLAVMELLVKKGIPPDAPSKGSGTPLATACKSEVPSPDAVAIASKLLALGADPNAKSAGSPLHSAVLTDLALVRLLLESGANPNAVSEIELRPTPLHLAAWHNRTDAAHLLIKHGAHPGAYDASQQTPLFLAVRFGHPEMVRLLAAAKADLDQLNDRTQQLTALHVAADAGNLELIRILAATGADPTARAGHPTRSPDLFGMTARRVAEGKGHSEAAALLAKLEQQWTERAAAKPVAPPTQPAPKKPSPPAQGPKRR